MEGQIKFPQELEGTVQRNISLCGPTQFGTYKAGPVHPCTYNKRTKIQYKELRGFAPFPPPPKHAKCLLLSSGCGVPGS